MEGKNAFICKQASRLTTIGKCYPATRYVSESGCRLVAITLDNDATAYIDDDNQVCIGGYNGIAMFTPIRSYRECFFGQPALTGIEAKAISVMAYLELWQINPELHTRISSALYNGDCLRFVDAVYNITCSAIKATGAQDAWLNLALSLSEIYINTDEVLA